MMLFFLMIKNGKFIAKLSVTSLKPQKIRDFWFGPHLLNKYISLPKCDPLCKKKPHSIVDMSYYVTNENSFLDIKNAHLRVTGNVHTDVLKVGSIGFQPAGSNISGTVNFTNVTTGVTTTSNLNVGGTLNLGTIELSASTHTLDHITARGSVTSTTVQFDNATTGLVTTSNVEVGGELTVNGTVDLLSVSNVASVKKDSNVVTEFPRSKKLIKYPRVEIASGESGLDLSLIHI